MTRPPPQFRPPRSRLPVTNTRQRWIRYGILTGAAALIIALGAVLLVQFLDGGDDGGTTPAGQTAIAESTGGSADSREPLVANPAFQFNIQLNETPDGYVVGESDTYGISAEGWAGGEYFAAYSAGEQAAKDWGYEEGFQTVFEPAGKSAEVALGQYNLRSEVYRFTTTLGAHEAYAYLNGHHARFGGSTTVSAKPLGNESSAFTMTTGTIPGTELPAAYHRFIARRGNLVYIVQVHGVLEFTSVDQARDWAVLIDEKILGERDAPLPTPTPQNTGAAAAETIPTTPTP